MDAELKNISIEDFRAGNQAVWKAVFAAYSKLLFFISFKILGNQVEAEDVVVESMVSLWKEKAKIKEPGHIKPWLLTAVRNCSIDIIRSKERRSVMYVAQPEILSDETQPDVELIEMEYQVILCLISELIKKLPPKRKEIFRLHFIEGIPIKEIADRMGLAASTVYTQLDKAKENIRKEIPLTII